MSHTVREILEMWEEALRDGGIESPRAEAEILYCFLTDKKRGGIFLDYPEPCPEYVIEHGARAVERRLFREPLQYILGLAPFMNLELRVTPDVLIPRPETEILVETVLKKLPPNGRFLDVGTGSGAIALAVAAERPDVSVVALDISPAALAVAQQNAAENNLQSRVIFRESNLLSALRPGEQFDAIAANLPYISESEYLTLQPEVKDHEPKLALTAPDDGLELILQLIPQLPSRLTTGGFAILEIGATQATRLSALYPAAKIILDYNRLPRFILLKK